jgi:hypothetical protein
MRIENNIISTNVDWNTEWATIFIEWVFLTVREKDFVDGIFECEFYTFLKPNLVQLQKMQL